MKINIATATLRHLIDTVLPAVSSKSSLPVLANIYLEAAAGQIACKATDLEVGVIASASCFVDQDGKTTVPAKPFAELLRTLDGDTVSLDLEGGKLRVKCGRSKTTFATIPADEYPPFPDMPTDDALTLPAGGFRQIVERTLPTAATDQARPVLCGVYLHDADGRMASAAADGFRLAVASIPGDPGGHTITAVVPTKAAKLMAKAATGETVRLFKRGGQMIFDNGLGVVVVSQLIEGSYPQIYNIIPTKSTTSAHLETAALMRAVAQAEIFAREGSSICRLEIGADGVVVTGQSEETGNASTTIEANVSGPALTIGLNVRFLRDALSVIKTGRVALEFTTSVAPVVVRPDTTESDFVQVIMPMHLGN
jgi:DNA polymerase-3 subunit beta